MAAKPIESLRRGLIVLDALTDTRLAPFTLHALHRYTAIPKPSLLSILETFRQEGMIEEVEGVWQTDTDWLNRMVLCSTHRLHRHQAERRFA